MKVIMFILLLFSCSIWAVEFKENIKIENNLKSNNGFKKINLSKNSNFKDNNSQIKFFMLAYSSFFVLIIIYMIVIFLKISKLNKDFKRIKLIMEKNND